MSGVITAYAAVAYTAYSIYAGQKAGKQQDQQLQMQRQAADEQRAAMAAEEKVQEQALNKSTATKASAAMDRSRSQQAGKQAGSTLLTGAGGDPIEKMGRKTLLGG